MDMRTMEELTEMIRLGWGDVRGDRIPADWRENFGPGITGAVVRHWVDGYLIPMDPLKAEGLPTLQGDLTPTGMMDGDAFRCLRNASERRLLKRGPKVGRRRPKRERMAIREMLLRQKMAGAG